MDGRAKEGSDPRITGVRCLLFTRVDLGWRPPEGGTGTFWWIYLYMRAIDLLWLISPKTALF